MSQDMPDFEAARLTVRLPAIVANYRTYRRMAGPTAVAAVVKADGYGLGADRSRRAGGGPAATVLWRGWKRASPCARKSPAPASWCWTGRSPMRCRRSSATI